MTGKTYKGLFFFFHEAVLNHQHAVGYHSCFYSGSLFLSRCQFLVCCSDNKRLAVISENEIRRDGGQFSR